MTTDVRERRLLVTSDTHIGNLFCHGRRGLVRLLEYAREHGYNVCINGDGIDVQYTSLQRFTAETAALLRELRRLTEDLTIYYTIGNHDIVLEHYLGSWGGLRLVPFLNVTSGSRRIRIEHGHLYDPVLVKHNVRFGFTWTVSSLFKHYPPAYHWHARYEALKYGAQQRVGRKRPAAAPALRFVSDSFYDAAEEIAQRGFDAVVFGHTHYAGSVDLEISGARYFNTGSWFKDPHCLVIEDGDLQLVPVDSMIPGCSRRPEGP